MARVERLNEVICALRKAGKRHAKNFSRGLKKAGLFLQRESQKIVPIDTGNLRNSAFTRAEGEGFETTVIVGYTASYAIYVHEIITYVHAPGKSAKFLERPAREKGKEVVAIILAEMKK